MNTVEALHARKSIRAFKPDPVPKETIEKILSAALRSPSYMNTQPWEVAVVMGKKRDELSKILVRLAENDTVPALDIPIPSSWPPELEKRLADHAERRARHLGIELSDPGVRKQMRINNFRFYGAPCVIFLFQDRSLGKWSMLDAGIFIQSLMLAAQEFGLGAVPQGILAHYPDEVRAFLHITESKRLVIGISLGCADNDAKINSYQSSRAGMSEVVKWYE